MDVNFKFELDEKVKTVFGDNGIVVMCAIDDGGNTYYVKVRHNSQWFKEAELQSAG